MLQTKVIYTKYRDWISKCKTIFQVGQNWQPNFSKIEEISSPSELHGLLTGIVCVTQAPSREEWQHILATLEIPELSEEALALLADEAEDVAHALSDDELDYLTFTSR